MVHLANSRTDDPERIGGNLYLHYISLSAEKEMIEDTQRDKRKNRKLHSKTLQASRTTANLPKILKPKPDGLKKRTGIPLYPET